MLQKKNYLNGQREFDVVQALQTVFISITSKATTTGFFCFEKAWNSNGRKENFTTATLYS